MNSKERILYIQDILHRETDENLEMTLDDLMTELYKISEAEVNKKTLRHDLKVLEESGLFDVVINQEKNGKENMYSHQGRLFEIHELRLLVDAIAAAKFITSEETTRMIEKLKKLTSKHLASQLDNRLVLPENTKSEDTRLKYTIHALHEAIQQHRVIRYQYGQYTIDKKFEYRYGGQIYELKPFALVWNHEFYYLIGEYIPEQQIRHYRVDRIRNVQVLEETFFPPQDFNVNHYIPKLFHMFAGEEQDIQLECHIDFLNVMFDRFGRDVSIRPVSEERFLLSTKAVLSRGLVSWMLTWGANVKVVHPPSLADEIQNEAEKLLKQYN